MSGVNGWGPIVDLNIVEKRIGRLKKFIFNNQMTLAHSLSTTILGDVTALNTTIQGASDKNDLPVDPTLPLRDTEYQTSDS